MSEDNKSIRFVEKSLDVEIYLPDDRVISGPRGTILEEFIKALPEWQDPLIVGAVVNRELRELTYPIHMDSTVQPITMEDADGALIYRRSITFLLEAAFEELFPHAGLRVDHSVSSGGYFCQITGRDPLTKEEVNALEIHMRYLVMLALPLIKCQVPIQEAIEYFRQKGLDDKVLLLKFRQKSHLVLYQLGEHRDYLHGYMVPNTSYLQWFALTSVETGFILRYPRRKDPAYLQPLPDSSLLLDTFSQYGKWLSRLGIHDVGSLNSAIQAGQIREIILVSEALHERRIAEIATKIYENREKSRIILISGPSSSGKTTFSKRLSVQLIALGISPFPLEMDNYFVDRDNTPRDEKGDYDFETIKALNTNLLKEHVHALIDGKEVELPRFDFVQGKCQLETGNIVRLEKDQLIILEGIHGLNPDLLPGIPEDQTFRVYASCLTQLNLDRYNRISTTDSRLIRRIVRDSRERGYTAQQTISRWESVRRGEKRHIFPFQLNAREMLNSALVYELSVLKPLAEPILRQVPYGSPEHIEAKRLLALLEWFLPLDADLIPDNSIVREFIGGSILKEFKLFDHPEKWSTV